MYVRYIHSENHQLIILWFRNKDGSSRQDIPLDSAICHAEPQHFSPLTTLRDIPTQILDDGQSPKHSQCQNRAVQEWSVQQVSHWLMSLNLEQYVSEFSAQNITGEQLLQLDGNKLKVKNYICLC